LLCFLTIAAHNIHEQNSTQKNLLVPGLCGSGVPSSSSGGSHGGCSARSLVSPVAGPGGVGFSLPSRLGRRGGNVLGVVGGVLDLSIVVLAALLQDLLGLGLAVQEEIHHDIPGGGTVEGVAEVENLAGQQPVDQTNGELTYCDT
jgi:hypothetical protein